MQKEGDVILGQVRRKLTEATRAQNLMAALQKLRNLRTERLNRQGEWKSNVCRLTAL